MKYDVCIIGAGPAGVSAATCLANQGVSVALIEKHGAPGQKSCGGGLTPLALNKLAVFLGVSPSSLQTQFEAHCRLRVVSPSGTVVVESYTPYMYVGNRTKWLGQLLAHASASDHVCVMKNRRCRGVGDGVVYCESGESIKADKIVAADGPKSLVRRKLLLPSGATVVSRQLVISKRAISGGAIECDIPTVWFDYRRFGAGYGWAFPFREEVRVGCSVPRSSHSNRQLNVSFFDWLKMLRVPVFSGKLESGSIGAEYVGHRMGRVFLAGDAAGMASVVSGEGIWQGIVSGEEVAKEIIDPLYQSPVIPQLASRHQRIFNAIEHPFVGRVLYNNCSRFLSYPMVANRVLKIFS